MPTYTTGSFENRAVKKAKFDTSSTDTTLVAAVTGKSIRVRSMIISVTAAATVRFESGTGGTDLSGQIPLPANGGFVLPDNPNGWFNDTASATLLNMELSAGRAAGAFTYEEL